MMVTYVRTPCRCCGETIDWAPYNGVAPRCDECRRDCYRPRGGGYGKPCRKRSSAGPP